MLALSPQSTSALAQLRVFERMDDAEPAWRSLEGSRALMTPYQTFDWCALWQRDVGEPAGFTPAVLVAFDASGEPLCLFPLARRRAGPFKVAEFFGGSHSNFNMPVWRQDALPSFSEQSLREMLAQLGERADVLVLRNQPLAWNGIPNPLAALPHALSPSAGYSGSLMADFEALWASRASGETRRKIRKKERKLAGLGEVRFLRAQTVEERKQVLDAFIAQKSARMHERGLSDVFSAPDVRAFIEAAGMRGVIELFALCLNGEIIATTGGIHRDGRFSTMFNSIIPERLRQESPGEQLLICIVREMCERGVTTFDLGTGEAAYKAMFCPDKEPLFDSFLPLTPAGKVIALAAQTAGGMKRAIKQNPVLWSAVETARRLRAQLSKS